jgi:Flp pilus assembly protein TadB
MASKALGSASGRCSSATSQFSNQNRKEPTMLWTICVILLILWLLGLVSGYTMGGVIHILLVIAIVVVLVRVIQGRRPL